MTDDDINDRKLIGLYRDLAEMTKPKCDACPSAKVKQYRCCHKWACELAKEYAQWHWNVELNFTGHPDIPFMDAKGRCTIPPHFRPMCASHMCSPEETGVEMESEWEEGYFELRKTITELEETRRARVSRTSYGA